MTKETEMEGKSMRVIVAIDGSEPAGLAVDLVAEVAWPAGTEILMTEAVESEAGLFGGPWPALAMVQCDRIEAQVRDQAQWTVDVASVLRRSQVKECPSRHANGATRPSRWSLSLV